MAPEFLDKLFMVIDVRTALIVKFKNKEWNVLHTLLCVIFPEIVIYTHISV